MTAPIVNTDTPIRERLVVPEAHYENATVLYCGDRLILEKALTQKGWRYFVQTTQPENPDRCLYGYLDQGTSNDVNACPDAWAASVASPGRYGLDGLHPKDDLIVRLKKRDQDPCGCQRNLGGYIVTRCEVHEQEAVEQEAHRLAGEGHGTPGWTDDPRREQDEVHRQITGGRRG